jgi:hypothetical protein
MRMGHDFMHPATRSRVALKEKNTMQTEQKSVPVGTVVNFRKLPIGSIVDLPDGSKTLIIECKECGDGAILHTRPDGQIIDCHELTWVETPEV